jgi:aminoglycoside 6'-N-acetyltransferase
MTNLAHPVYAVAESRRARNTYMTNMSGPRLSLRSVEPGDVGRLLEILRQPAVAEFWSAPPTNDEEAEAERALLLGSDADGAEAISTFAILLGSSVIGWIAGWEKLEPEYRHAGIDLFLDSAEHGKGYGPEAIRLVCHFLFDERGHHRITIDPSAANTRAIRSYEKVGFKRVGVLRRYERSHDGTFHDGLLLDLLPEDLR